MSRPAVTVTATSKRLAAFHADEQPPAATALARGLTAGRRPAELSPLGHPEDGVCQGPVFETHRVAGDRAEEWAGRRPYGVVDDRA